MTTYQKRKTYTTKNKYPFYGVAGENAFAVFGDYQEAHAMRHAYRKFKIKGFDSFDEAEEWAEHMYRNLSGLNGWEAQNNPFRY